MSGYHVCAIASQFDFFYSVLFNIKLEAVQEQISETIKRSTATIIMSVRGGLYILTWFQSPNLDAAGIWATRAHT